MASLALKPVNPTAQNQVEEYQLRSSLGHVVMVFDNIDRARQMLKERQACGSRLRLFRSRTVVEEIYDGNTDASAGDQAEL